MARARITQREPNTLSGIVERGGPVRLSFFAVPRLPRLAPPHIAPDNGLQVAALLDLAGTTANVVQLRAEAKDYRDIDAILRDGRIDLPMALAAAQAMYGATFNPQITLKALSHFADSNLPRLARALRRYVSDDDFREALDKAPPGIIDARSWSYWNNKMGRYPAPPLPRRKFG